MVDGERERGGRRVNTLNSDAVGGAAPGEERLTLSFSRSDAITTVRSAYLKQKEVCRHTCNSLHLMGFKQHCHLKWHNIVPCHKIQEVIGGIEISGEEGPGSTPRIGCVLQYRRHVCNHVDHTFIYPKLFFPNAVWKVGQKSLNLQRE